MFDLIGFWFVVSLVCILLFAPMLIIIQPLGAHLVYKITENNCYGNRVGDFIFKTGGCQHSIIFNRFKIYDFWAFIIPTAGIFCWLGYLISIPVRADHYLPELSLVDCVSIISTKTSSFMGYVGIFFLIYYGTIFFGKQIWKLKVKVDEIIEKTSD